MALCFARGFKKSACRVHGFSTERARLAGALRFARGFKQSACRAHGFSTEHARLAGVLRFTRGFKKVPVVHTASAQNVQD